MKPFRTIFSAIVIGITLLGFSGVAFAIPTLQLDAIPGVYFDGTTYSTGTSFTLRAILYPEGDKSNPFRPPATLLDTFYVSVALVPRVEFTAGGLDLGSFSYDSTTVNVTGDMKYGFPPIDTVGVLQPKDQGDLPPHGAFPTYYTEIQFKFDRTPQLLYNVADDSLGKGVAYYKEFAFDISALNSDYALHFDLYNKFNRTATDKDIGDFAPFSHDAETRLPEATTGLLMGTGLAGLIIWRRKKRFE